MENTVEQLSIDIKQEINRTKLINDNHIDFIINEANKSPQHFNDYLYTLVNMRDVDKIIALLKNPQPISIFQIHRLVELSISIDGIQLFLELFKQQGKLQSEPIKDFNQYAFNIATKDFNKDIIYFLLSHQIDLNYNHKKCLFKLADNVFYLSDANDCIIKILSDNRLIWDSEDEKIDFLAYCAKLNLVVIVKHLITHLAFNVNEAIRYSTGELKIWAKTYKEKQLLAEDLKKLNSKKEDIKKI